MLPNIIVAPMAGGPSTPELVAGAVNAGAYGFLAAGYVTPAALAAQIAGTRKLTAGAFGVNVFVPGEKSTVDLDGYAEKLRSDYGIEPGDPAWTDDEYPAKLDVLVDDPVDTVSFTFGLPSAADVERLRAVGSKIVITVTSPAEARLAARLRPDALCVQGFEAGAHRGIFVDDGSPAGAPAYGLLAALRLVGAAVDLPLIAAGGLVHGADIAAVLTAGAVAAQLGTAFLRCPEAGTQPLHRQALSETRETAVTRAFSGRPARALVNRFLTGNTELAPAAYPQVNSLTKPIRAAAAKSADPEAMSLYAGQAYSQAPQGPVADVVAQLDAQLRAALKSAGSALDRATP
ncbi:NAD(P)H-dependent flavin oxidoreductase [Kibdelosporangium phytohabitans]|uniref:Propionate 3-nitronate monooxygenase n=1 Tax=Kibdelosporangium phytohabitans TaxID=860235 RepID=A0A0N9HLZ6_9PSEU|nr:nitronate monooxygenase [Kibdelosporangium phytohabitans]ALG07514.1 2-nitropropane dioxygenase [Kibdelosporangium phytohabitans]MBE1471566.1 nitronate monooxygenase [Kibdelosporangium phytohabitans]